MIVSKYRDAFQALRNVESEFKQKLGLLQIISRYFNDRGAKIPIVVGGEAVEIYTRGGFTSHDIDLKSSMDVLVDCLEKELGFRRVQHAFNSVDPPFAIEWQGAALEEGREGEDRVRIIQVGDDRIVLIGFEDLIVDRLNAAKFSQHAESYEQAKELYLVTMLGTLSFDEEYALLKAKQDDVLDYYQKMVGEVRASYENDALRK